MTLRGMVQKGFHRRLIETVCLVSVFLGAVHLVRLGFVYHDATRRPIDAGIGWRSATVRPGRVVRPTTAAVEARPAPPAFPGVARQNRPGGPPDRGVGTLDDTGSEPWAAIGWARGALVRVLAPDGDATGFAVARDGLIVTACHAVDGKSPLFVVFDGVASPSPKDGQFRASDSAAVGARLPARVLRAAPAWDLALLEVFEPGPAACARRGGARDGCRRFRFPAALVMADGAGTPEHCPVIVPAFAEPGPSGPSAGVLVDHAGPVLAVRNGMDGVVTLVMGVRVSAGQSGSPVLDVSGRVVGVVTARRVGEGGAEQGLSYAVVSNYLFEGSDALFRDALPTAPLSPRFLGQQLAALARRDRGHLPVRGVAADLAFVTGAGDLGLVVACPAGVHGEAPVPVFDVRVVGADGDPVLDVSVEGRLTSSHGDDPGPVLSGFFRLTAAERARVVSGSPATLEVRYHPCLLSRRLPLVADEKVDAAPRVPSARRHAGVRKGRRWASGAG